MDRLRHRFFNRSAILTWFIQAAIVWVLALPLVWRAIQVLQRFHGAAPAFVVFFLILAIVKVSLLALLGRALEREQCKRRVLSGYNAASH